MPRKSSKKKQRAAAATPPSNASRRHWIYAASSSNNDTGGQGETNYLHQRVQRILVRSVPSSYSYFGDNKGEESGGEVVNFGALSF